MASIFGSDGKMFINYIGSITNQYKGNLANLVKDSTMELFFMRREQKPYMKSLSPDKMLVGRFYLICYDFNGNKLFCPILTIDFRVSNNNKPNIYAINLDYLPFEYKKQYFGRFYEIYKQTFEDNNGSEDVFKESSFPLNFEDVYKSLQSNGKFHYSISAFDLKKIKECYLVSTNLLHVLLFSHMREVNISLLKDNMTKYEEDADKTNKLKNTISELENMKHNYDTDVQGYYKRLRNIENNYKLFENE